LITGNHDRRHLANKATSAALASPTTKDGQRSGSRDGSVGDWVVLIMISGLAAIPALLSASRTAFGLVGLDTGEIIDF